MSEQGPLNLALALACLGVLTACETVGLPLRWPSAAPAEATAASEAPAGTFRLQAVGVWDGRPSLGGAWVAHADVDAPRKVVITNDETGESVRGALFRRGEVEPGPEIQVSSEAAEALGLAADAPTPLTIVATEQQIAVEESAGPAADAAPVSPDPIL